jgi:uncharacterized membrane protein
MQNFAGLNQVLKFIAVGIEAAGVAIIVLGALITTAVFLKGLLKDGFTEEGFRSFRSGFGKAILLGLEFLVASDIVGTVAVGPTLQDLGVLGLLVAIRTFLSFALEVEVTGRWPWKGYEIAGHSDKQI